MRVLVACEESQAVTKELRALGHEAFSCDLYPSSGGRPEWHLQQNVIPLLTEEWDMIIAFPTCTYLTNAGTRHYSRRMNPEWKVLERERNREEAAKFFMLFANAPCPRIAIENPVGYMNRVFRAPDQIIHPYYFGHPYTKRTCLWLKGLPKLVPTNMLPHPEPMYICAGEKSGGKKIGWCEGMRGIKGGQEERAKARSKTFPGIARAMAEQWAGPASERSVVKTKNKTEEKNTMTELIKALTDLARAATAYLERGTHPMLPLPAATTGAEEPKKTRKAKTEKSAEPPAAEKPAEPSIEDQLGLGGQEEKKEEKPAMTPKESEARMDEVTRQYIRLTKTDTPDGKTIAIGMMKNDFKVGNLKDLSHEKRLEWIAAMEKLILEHK